MRLKEYILEREKGAFELSIKEILIGRDDLYIEFIKKVKKDCGPWLRASKGLPVYRGMRMLTGIVIYNKKVRKDREPLSMEKENQELYDKLFYDKFGWKPRSEGLFASGNISGTYNYGYTYMIYPIGKFKFLWNPYVRDLYAVRFMDKNKFMDTYTDKGLIDAIKSNNEIMIKCDSYHVIRII